MLRRPFRSISRCALLLTLFGWSAAPASAQGWERPVRAPETAPPPRRAAELPRRAAPADRAEAVERLYGDSATRYSPRYGQIPAELFSQTLDAHVHPLSCLLLTLTPESDFGTFGEAATLELEGALRIFAFEEFLGGYLEGAFNLRLLGYLDNPGLEALPDVAAHLALDLVTSWRFWNGWSLELRAAPGLYSDIAEPQFNCLATVNLHYTVHPTLAFLGGVTVRPDWDLPVFPNVGLAWQPHEVFRVEAMLPRSRVLLSPFRGLALFGTLEWRNFDFALQDEPGFPEAFTVDEWLATAGIAVGTGEDTRLTAEFGTYLSRELRADVVSDSTVPIAEEWLVRIGWHGAF